MLDEYADRMVREVYEWCNCEPWNYTPFELATMLDVAVKRFNRDNYLADIRTARICLYLNLPYREGDVYLKEFMPGYDPNKDKPEQGPQDMESMIKLINTVFQGEEK